MKSHSQHDLDVSVDRGVWATQLYNEAVLNKAFETCENVYLIFSINKSGEFFGLARMASPSGNSDTFDWSKDSTATSSTTATTSAASTSSPSKEASPPAADADQPAVPDKVAPSSEEKDSQVPSNLAAAAVAAAAVNSARVSYSCPPPTQPVAMVSKDSLPGHFGLTNQTLNGPRTLDSWGKPFDLQWLSLKRIPFQYTSHIRNQWNDNNEIKVSRDGTEIEPYAASLLHTMFTEDGPGSPGDAATGSAASPISSPMMARVPYPGGAARRFSQPQFSGQGDYGVPYYVIPYANVPYQPQGYKQYPQYPQHPQQMVPHHPQGNGVSKQGPYPPTGYYQNNGLFVVHFLFFPLLA